MAHKCWVRPRAPRKSDGRVARSRSDDSAGACGKVLFESESWPQYGVLRYAVTPQGRTLGMSPQPPDSNPSMSGKRKISAASRTMAPHLPRRHRHRKFPGKAHLPSFLARSRHVLRSRLRAASESGGLHYDFRSFSNRATCRVRATANVQHSTTLRRCFGRSLDELEEAKKLPCCWAGCIHRNCKMSGQWHGQFRSISKRKSAINWTAGITYNVLRRELLGQYSPVACHSPVNEPTVAFQISANDTERS